MSAPAPSTTAVRASVTRGPSASTRAALRAAPPPRRRERRRPGVVAAWLGATRAGALPATLGAGLVAGALAVRLAGFSWPLYLLALLGIVLAHASTGLLHGLSVRDEGSRAAAGLVPRRQVGLALIALWLAELGVIGALTVARGWPVVAFALAGAVLSVVHTARPLRRLTRALGELDVALACGPLVVAGTCVAAAGALPWQVWAAGVPYGLLCATVLLGRHVDDAADERPAGPPTLPRRLGETGARALALVALVGFYAATGLAVAAGVLPWPALVVALALPRLREVARDLRRRRSGVAPERALRSSCGAVLLRHARPAGGLLVLGLLAAAWLDVGLPPGA